MRRNDGRRKSRRAVRIGVSKSASSHKAKYRTIPSVSHSCISVSKNGIKYFRKTRSSKNRSNLPITNVKIHNLRYGRRIHPITNITNAKTRNLRNRSNIPIRNITNINLCNSKNGSILPVKNAKICDSKNGSSRSITDVTNARICDQKNGIIHPVTNATYVKAPVFKYSKCRTCRIPCNGDILAGPNFICATDKFQKKTNIDNNFERKTKYIIGSKALKLGGNFCVNALHIDDRQETFVKNEFESSTKNLFNQLEPGDVYMDNEVNGENGDFSCGSILKLDGIVQMKNMQNGNNCLKLNDSLLKNGGDRNLIVQSSLIDTFKKMKNSIVQNQVLGKSSINIDSKNGHYNGHLSEKTPNCFNMKKVSDSQEIIMVSINNLPNERNDNFISNDSKTTRPTRATRATRATSKTMNHSDVNTNNNVTVNGKDIDSNMEITDNSSFKCLQGDNDEKKYNFDLLLAIGENALNASNGYLSRNNEENDKKNDSNVKEIVIIPGDCERTVIVQSNSLETSINNDKKHGNFGNVSDCLNDDEKNEKFVDDTHEKLMVDSTMPSNSTNGILKNIDPNLLDYPKAQTIEVSKQEKNHKSKSCKCCVIVSDCSKYLVDLKRKRSPNHCREHNLIHNRKHVRLKEKNEKSLDFTSENDCLFKTVCVLESSRRLKFLHNRFYSPFVATNEVVMQKILENISLDIEMLEDNNMANKCEWRQCNQQFNGSAKLLDHLKICHIYPSSNNTVFVCQWRKCKFSNQPSSSFKWLSKHVLRHCRIKPFKCVILGCEMSFSTQSGLARHVPSHFNEGKVRRTCVLTGVDKTLSQEYGIRSKMNLPLHMLENGEELDDSTYDLIRKRTRHEMFVDRYKSRKIGDTGSQKGYNAIKYKVQLTTCNSSLNSGYTGNHFRFDHKVIGKRTSLDGSSDMLLSPSLTNTFPYKSFWFDAAALKGQKSMFVDISVSKLSEDIKQLLYDKERVSSKLKNNGKYNI